MWFRISYILYLVVCLLFGNVGLYHSVSIRHAFTFYMFACCLIQREVKFDKFLNCYLVFLVFYGLSCLITGFGSHFLRNLVGTYFAAIVMYWATILLLKKYDGGILIIRTVLAVAVANAIVAIGQFYQNPYASGITAFFYSNMEEDIIEMYEQLSDFHGRYVSGMMGVVNSGYFMSAASVLALYNGKGRVSIWNVVLFAVIFYGLFLGQERAGFYCSIICVSLYLVMSMNRNKAVMVTLIVVAFFALAFLGRYGDQLFSFDRMRYNSVADNGLRIQLVKNGWQYFMQHPLGAYLQWVEEGHEQAHNVIVNSFLMGGVLGGIIGVYIIISHIVKLLFIVFSSFKKEYSTLLLVLVVAYLNYTLNSFFHNPSLLGGVAMYFVLWAGICCLYEKEKAEKSLSSASSCLK